MRPTASAALLLALAVPMSAARAGTLVVDPAAWNFGLVSVSAGPAPMTITVTNFGAATTITGVVPTGSCAEFTVTPGEPFPVVLLNAQSLSLEVAYDPSNRTADICNCTIQDDNADTDAFELRGDGAASRLQLWTTTLPFADQPWNSAAHETLSVLIENAGEEPFDEANLGRALTTGSHFRLGAPAGSFPVAAGGTIAIPVVFDPASTGPKSDFLTLSLDNDSPGDANPTVPLSGTGTEAVSVGPDPSGGMAALAAGPSPTRGLLQARVAFPRAGVLEVVVSDLAGRVVARSRTIESGAGARAVEFHAGRDWSPRPGLYFVRARLDGEWLGARRITVVR